MKLLLNLLLVLVTLAYPLLVYLGIRHISPAVFAAVLIGLALGRFVISRYYGKNTKGDAALLIVVLSYSLILLLSPGALLLKLYPVLISLCVALIFALSLNTPESLIERLARLAGETITPRAKGYTRRLTAIWAILLVANALVALYLALFGSMAHWALYTGLISYLLFGCFFAVEYGYRRYYIHKYRDQP